jgi:hypothetical protein
MQNPVMERLDSFQVPSGVKTVLNPVSRKEQDGVYNYVNLHVYHYAGNNPVKLVDPDGKFLINTAFAHEYVMENPKALFSMQFHPMVMIADFEEPAFMHVKGISPFFPIRLEKQLDGALRNVINIRRDNSKLIDTKILASVTHIGKGVYQIDLQISAIMTDPLTGKRTVVENQKETIAFATGLEAGATPYRRFDQDKVNSIANKVLDSARRGVQVDK